MSRRGLTHRSEGTCAKSRAGPSTQTLGSDTAMNIGIVGAIFLWVLMLWPILVSIGYLLWCRPRVKNVPALAVASIVIGYAAMVGIMMLADQIERWGINSELLVLVLPWATPIATTHILTRDASKLSKEGVHA